MKVVDLKTLITLPKGTIFIARMHDTVVSQACILGDTDDSGNHRDIKFHTKDLNEVDTAWQTGPGISPSVSYLVYEEEDLLTALENIHNALKVLGAEIVEG